MNLWQRFAVLVMVVALQACANVRVDLEEASTLAAVTPAIHTYQPLRPLRPPPDTESASDVDEEEVVNAYRELLSIIPPGSGDGAVLRRLADLELESSIQKRLSNNQRLIDEGDEESRQAIMRYHQYLKDYPGQPGNEEALYQLARAYEMDANPYGAAPVMERLVREYPQSSLLDEVQFRLGEHRFAEENYAGAAKAYAALVKQHPRSLFIEKSLYKLGWSHFKLNDYPSALDNFIALLDKHNQRHQIRVITLADKMPAADREMIEDVLRITSMTFSYLPGKRPLGEYLSKQRKRSFEPLLYDHLASGYLQVNRLNDAAETYLDFSERYPTSPYSSDFHDRAIAAVTQAGFINQVLKEKEAFIANYNKGTPYWEAQSEKEREPLQQLLGRHIFDVATHYHAMARSSKKAQDYQQAANYYRSFLRAFPKDEKASHFNFLLGEALYDGADYGQSIAEYEKTAYRYDPHENSAEAGYGSLMAYRKLISQSEESLQAELNEGLLESSLRFTSRFKDDKRVAPVLLKAVNNLFDLGRFEPAQTHAQRLLDLEQADNNSKHSASIIVAHSLFQLQRYEDAEKAYLKALEGVNSRSRVKYRELREQLALSIYRQGEQALVSQDLGVAAGHFLRVGKTVPESDKRITADYDAATAYINLKEWALAISVLQDFRKHYPKHREWKKEIAEKLALSYTTLGQHDEAADELLGMLDDLPVEQQRDTLWHVAGLYQRAGKEGKTMTVYQTYIQRYPKPLDRAIELRQRIAGYYQQEGNLKLQQQWLREIIKADQQAGNERTERSRFLAASASLELIRPLHASFSDSRLSIPLRKSLRKKKSLMTQAIDGYNRAARYQVEEVTTQATFHIAEIYRDFAVALLASERPADLNEDELEEYNYLLEEQAYPFEEKSISLHEKNLQRIAASGSWDQSIQNSLKALGKLLPFRYAKSEVTEGFVDDRL